MVIVSAILFPLALQNELFLYGNPIIGLLCLSLFFWALYETPSYKIAAFYGAIFGGISSVIANFWLINFNAFAVFTLGGTALGYIGFNMLLSVILRYFSRITITWRPFLVAAVFCVYEYLKSIGFLGYPWGLIAYSVHSVLPFLQIAEITGLWGISFILLLSNTVIAEYLYFLFSPRQNSPTLQSVSYFSPATRTRIFFHALYCGSMIFLLCAYGVIRLSLGFAEKDSLSTLLVQQNAYPWGSSRAIESLRTAEDLTKQGLAQLKNNGKPLPDIVVWNETALKYPVPVFTEFPFTQNEIYKRYFPGIFTEFDVPSLTGAPAVDIEGKYYNAALLIMGDGSFVDFYAKQHPVPFVENIPFYEFPIVRDFFHNVIGIRQYWTMGSQTKLFHLDRRNKPSVAFGTPICFEDVFADLCRKFVVNGADLLVNLTNDSWSQTNSALTQHIAAARFRSIENRITMIRGTNAGITCIIDASGAITHDIPMFTKSFLSADAPVYYRSIPTIYTMLGDYFPNLLLLLLILALFSDRFKLFTERLTLFIKRIFNQKTA